MDGVAGVVGEKSLEVALEKIREIEVGADFADQSSLIIQDRASDCAEGVAHRIARFFPGGAEHGEVSGFFKRDFARLFPGGHEENAAEEGLVEGEKPADGEDVGGWGIFL